MVSAKKVRGWLLDVQTTKDSNEVSVWIKSDNGHSIRLEDHYDPLFYIEPKSEESGNELAYELSKNNDEGIYCKTSWVEKRSSIYNEVISKVIEVTVPSASARGIRQFVRRLEEDPRVKILFNTDLSAVQQYLFTTLRVEPTSKVDVEFQGSALKSIKKVDDDHELVHPPFTTLYFAPKSDSDGFLSGDGEDSELSIDEIECNADGAPKLRFTGSEETVIEDFNSFVIETDPDILVCRDCDNITFPWLTARATKKDIRLNLGRHDDSNDIHEDVRANTRVSLMKGKRRFFRQQPFVHGRTVLDFNRPFDFQGLGIAGLVERSRFSYLPMQIASRWGSNRIIDSRNCFELIKRGYLIPKNNGFYEPIRSLDEIFAADKGSMIISPQVGLHANVAVLDYDSEYPNIIVRNNLSYETVSREGVRTDIDGLLPVVMKRYLSRRNLFKNVVKTTDDNQYRMWSSQRATALKTILVSLYGTAGCCWSRFGNVLTFEEVNRKSRQIMIMTKELALAKGFQVVYGDTDAAFIKKSDASHEDYSETARAISAETGLPMSVAYHYKFLVLLPIEADERIDALKRYFGITTDGEVVARGIEMRRHDVPAFIKAFQENLIRTLLAGDSVENVYDTGIENALNLLIKAIDNITTGDMKLSDLLITRTMGRDTSKYSILFPHVSAALQLDNMGISLKKGDDIDFIYTDSKHKNPLLRVRAITESQNNLDASDLAKEYDRDKYLQLLLDAAETVLAPFGFDRKLLGDGKARITDWRKELSAERRDAITAEIG